MTVNTTLAYYDTERKIEHLHLFRHFMNENYLDSLEANYISLL